jgi:hypothetical protein
MPLWLSFFHTFFPSFLVLGTRPIPRETLRHTIVNMFVLLFFNELKKRRQLPPNAGHRGAGEAYRDKPGAGAGRAFARIKY